MNTIADEAREGGGNRSWSNEEPAAASGVVPEAVARVTERSKHVMTSLGEIVAILMRYPAYRHLFLADLEWLVAPALAVGQFAIARAQRTESGQTAPIAAILWASVSEDVDARLTSQLGGPVRLKPHEWKSGPITWLVEGIGEPRAVKALIEQALLGPLKGISLKVAARDADGKPQVQIVTAPKSASAEAVAPNGAA